MATEAKASLVPSKSRHDGTGREVKSGRSGLQQLRWGSFGFSAYPATRCLFPLLIDAAVDPARREGPWRQTIWNPRLVRGRSKMLACLLGCRR